MGFSLAVGNQGFSGSQLQKTLLKHFKLPARDIVTAGRQFPISSRIDLQSGLESLLKADTLTQLVGLVSLNSHEGLTFAQILGGPHVHVDVGPLQYDDIDIGDEAPTRALKNGLWMGRSSSLPFAIMLAPGGRFGFHIGVGVEVAVPVGEAGAQFSQDFFRQLEQQISKGRSYRGRVISLEAHHHPMGGGSSVKVHRLAKVNREEVVLPKTTLATLDRNDGLQEDAEVLFILTTNRPDQIEPALVSRPGRIDQAIEFPVPDEDGRLKLTKLYARDLQIPDELLETIVRRTKGVSAAFIKELLRRCAQFQIETSASNVLDHLAVDAALKEMLFAGGVLNRRLLGGDGAPA